MVDRVDISRLLQDMRTLKSQTHAFPTSNGIGQLDRVNPMRQIGGNQEVAPVSRGPAFGDLFSQAVNKVNNLQQTSSSMANAYERGVAGVDITDVMVASQKASVAFQATVQVRNKVIEAYKDVMNMAI